jgi:hypothetical protein
MVKMTSPGQRLCDFSILLITAPSTQENSINKTILIKYNALLSLRRVNAMKILIINISDDHVLGDKCHEALKKRHPDAIIIQRNLLSAALKWLQGGKQESDETHGRITDNERQKESSQWNRHMSRLAKSTSIKCNITNPTDQLIYICAHGEIGDTTHCYYERFDSDKCEKLMSAKELSVWLHSVLNEFNDININIPLNFDLAMCFAARSLEDKINHIKNKDSIDFSKTFAAYLVRELTNEKPDLTIHMTAYIGEVSFNDLNGKIQVSIEERFLEYPIVRENQLRLHDIKTQIASLENAEEIQSEAIDCNERMALLYIEYNALKATIDQQTFQLSNATDYGKVLFEKHGAIGSLNINYDGLKPIIVSIEEIDEEAQRGCQAQCTVLSPKIGRY